MMHQPESLTRAPVTLTEAVRSLDTAPTGRGFAFFGSDGGCKRHSFRELGLLTRIRSNALSALLGLRKGDVLGLILSDPESFVVTFLAAMRLGVVLVPMYSAHSLTTANTYVSHVRGIAVKARTKAMVVDDSIHEVLSGLKADIGVVTTLSQLIGLEASLGDMVMDEELVLPDDVAYLQFTSGSTSLPKGVQVTHANLVSNFGAMHRAFNMDEQSKLGSWLPLYHDMGLIAFMLLPMYFRASAVFVPTTAFLRRPTVWLDTVSSERVTVTYAPNFAFALSRRITKVPEALDLSCLKVIGCGSEPIHPDTLWGFIDHFSRAKLTPGAVQTAYGMAEATLAITISDFGKSPRRERISVDEYRTKRIAVPTDSANGLEFVSCGKVIQGHELWVVDKQGKRLVERQVGEIMFRGPSVGHGYKNAPEATEATFTSDGLRTGDLGYIADGELFVTGRRKDLIIINGRNYDPESIEAAAASVKGVRPGNVIAFSLLGLSTEQVVVIAEAKSRGAEHLAAQVKNTIWNVLQLSVTEVVIAAPRTVPKTTSGKLRRSAARDIYLENRSHFAEESRV